MLVALLHSDTYIRILFVLEYYVINFITRKEEPHFGQSPNSAKMRLLVASAISLAGSSVGVTTDTKNQAQLKLVLLSFFY